MGTQDLRTLCDSCRADYEYAGYQVVKVWVKNKEKCDKCQVRFGWTYEIADHFRSLGGKSTESYQFRRGEFDSHRK